MNTIVHGDCIQQMKQLKAGSVDLVFADPPFNIGFDYDVYTDELPFKQYLDWSCNWMKAAHRILKSNGTFWLAIGDEYAAELKVEAQKIGFHCRSWVIWYYTFGVNCSRKFTRSHAHLFHFVKDPTNFVFRADALENRIPSARQLVYNDSRANPRGRLPDDTWIIHPANAIGEMSADEEWFPEDLTPRDADRTWTLRPQDLKEGFRAEEDTWYFPRVAGTFKERAGFHGCQMPEQLLGRIIRTCSEEGALVLDPFSGSATTAAVARKLGRNYLAFDMSEEYVRLGQKRLAALRVGDPLDGSAEPLVSAPQTHVRAPKGSKRVSRTSQEDQEKAAEKFASERQLQMTINGIIAAFASVYDGYSADRVVADPELNARFTETCSQKGLVGDPRTWNRLLFRQRKTGKLIDFPTSKTTKLEWTEIDSFLFASEIAWRKMLDDGRAKSLDEILCDPTMACEFDEIAKTFAPGFTPLQYRWAALKLRKQSKMARVRSESLVLPTKLGKPFSLDDFDPQTATESSGVYLLGDSKRTILYAGEAVSLRSRLIQQFPRCHRDLWSEYAQKYRIEPRNLRIRIRSLEGTACSMLAWQTCLVRKYNPKLNLAIG